MRGLGLVVALACASCGGNDQTIPDAAVGNLGPSDAAMCSTTDAAHCLTVDDAGVSHGCTSGGMGPGDRDDGGGLPPAPPPDLGADVMNQPFGAPCLFNAQCVSSICFDYRVKGQFCTQFCVCNVDCPAASLGCSGQGVCRVGN